MKHFRFIVQIAVAIGVCSAYAGPKEDLFRAIEIDAAHLVRSALATGLDPNSRDEQGQVPLVLAIRSSGAAVTEALLADPRVDIDAVNASGETPLMMAALRGDLALVRRLLERGAKINRDGWTPLHYAASGPSVEVVALLLDRGAAIEAPSPNGTTPLMMAARYGAIDAADLLLRRGADTRVRNQREMNAADFAAGAGREELARRLAPR